MKAGWAVKALGEVVRLEYGKPLPDELRKLDGQYSVYGANGEKTRSDAFYAKGPSLIIGRKGSAGEINVAEDDFWPLDVTYFTEHDPRSVEFGFLRYALSMLDLPNMARGVKPGINRNDVYARPIPLPPLDEQKRIVAVLDAAFEGLTRARAHTETNLQNARELFESGLLAVFGGLNDPKDQKLLREVSTEFGRGKSKHRPRNDKALYDGEFPFIQTGDVRNSRHIIDDYSQTYNEAGLAQSKLWPAGTVCITIAANIAETGVLGFKACFPDSIIGMVPDKAKTSSKYVEYLLQFFQKRLKALGEGSAQENINLATFETEYFPFPSLDVQADAVERLDQMHSTVDDLESHYRAKLADLDDLRQSLLQKAFAGELT